MALRPLKFCLARPCVRALLLVVLLTGWISRPAAAAAPPPELWSPRPVTQCEASVTCIDGYLGALDVSVDGRRAVFVTADNRFVAGDPGAYVDVVVSQGSPATPIAASTGAAGEFGDQDSDLAAISGSGRYVYFRSRAGNLVLAQDPPVIRGRTNLYVKDLATGQVGLIGRTAAGAPLNDLQLASISQIDADYTGRHVVFTTKTGGLVAGVTDLNAARDVFWLDLDPDGDGDYFDTPPATTVLSVTPGGTTTANGESTAPTITQDGRTVAFLTRATDLTPEVGGNGAAFDAILVHLGQTAAGDPDPAQRIVQPVNRMAAGLLTPHGVLAVAVDPWHPAAVFATVDNIPGTGDIHTGEDVYVAAGLAGPTPQLAWLSAGLPTSALEQLTAAWDPGLPSGSVPQVGWLAQNPPRTVLDLFARRSDPGFLGGLTALNWPAADTPSVEPVLGTQLSPDGRYVFWVTPEEYGPAPTGTYNLYRRAVAPAQPVTLTVAAVGGAANLLPAGATIVGPVALTATTTVRLLPTAGTGYRFHRWLGVDAAEGMTATVVVYASRTVTATFDPMTPPVAAGVVVTTAEDTPCPGITLAVVDPDPDEAHVVALVAPPAHGAAALAQNMVDYVPAADFAGTDAFALQVTDAYGLQLAAPAQVTVVVTPVNDPPRAAAAAGTGHNTGVGIPLAVTVDDPDEGDEFTLTVTGPPAHGTAAPAVGAQLVYTPAVGFDGVDTFEFAATDRAGAAVAGTAVVTVTAAPTGSNLYIPALPGSKAGD